MASRARRAISPASGRPTPTRSAEGADAADNWIVEHVAKGDICITADIPLAGRCLEKGARVLAPGGKAFTQDNIGMALGMRELSRHLRELTAVPIRPLEHADPAHLASGAEPGRQRG